MDLAVAGRQGERRRSRDQHAVTDFGNHAAQVANVIPPQQAGRIAEIAGATDNTGWCAIDPVTLRLQIGAEHPRHRRRLPRRRHAQIRILGAMRRPRPARAAIATLLSGGAPATPKLINTCYSLARPGLWHLGRRRLPAEERSAGRRRRRRRRQPGRCATRVPRARGRLCAILVFDRSRRKSLARRTHRISGLILAGALARPARLRGRGGPSQLCRRRRCHSGTAHEARPATWRAGARSSSNVPALASSATAAHFPNRSSRATWRLTLPVPAAAGPRASFGSGWWTRPASMPRPSCRPITAWTASIASGRRGAASRSCRPNRSRISWRIS